MAWADDIYFDPEYVKLYRSIELGEPKTYIFESSNGKIIHNFIKRIIPTEGTKEYYDIRTPYGYGGPLIVAQKDKNKLLEEFQENFAEYCFKENIVTEFVRFHPIAQNALDFKNIYSIELNRKTVGTNLNYSDDPMRDEFSKSCRKNIRRALNKGITYQYMENVTDLGVFKKIYYDTMNRNDANDFYYFDDLYFKGLINHFADKLLVVNALYDSKIIASGLYFVSNNIIHIHLSGTLNEYLLLNPAYVLRYAATKWAMEHNIKYIHHGGGRTTNDDDALFRFKKQFGINTQFDFYIAEKIWNQEIFDYIKPKLGYNETINAYIRRCNDEKDPNNS